MRAGSTSPRYGRVAATLHWIIALLLIAQIWTGWTFGDLPRGPERIYWFDWHKTLGFAILLLSLVRLGWRIANPPPPCPAAMPGWERVLARVTHVGFYVILIGLPLTGWAYISTGSGALTSSTTTLIGGIPFPFLPGLPRAGHDAFEEAHLLLVNITFALLALHLAGALKHLFVDRGPLARRMPPFDRMR